MSTSLNNYITSNNQVVNDISSSRLSKSQYVVDQANIQALITDLTNTKSDKTYVDERFTNLLGGVLPSTLDTIHEISQALQNDNNSINSIITTLGTKVSQSDYDNYVLLNNSNISDLQTNTEVFQVYTERK